MRVLINFVSLPRPGINMPRLLKFQALNSLGCDLDLFTGTFIRKMDLLNQDVYKFNENFPDFKRLPNLSKTKFSYLYDSAVSNLKGLGYIKRIIKSNYDVIYSPAATLELILIPYLIKRISRKNMWVCVFDNVVPFTDPGNKFVRFLAWLFFKISLFMMRKADKIFVISEDLESYLVKKKFSRKKIVLTGIGCENKLMNEAKADANYQIDALFMGRINETKGIYDMLRVLDAVRKKYPDFQLAIMGAGDKKTKDQFKRKIKEMNLENNIQFLGYRTGLEKYNIIKSAKCFWFLSVSQSESFGIALLEAVCCGIPAFAYDLPQFPQIYQNGEVNISPKGNWEIVAEKVLKLFEKRDFSNERGELLLGKYSWDKIAEIEYNSIINL